MLEIDFNLLKKRNKLMFLAPIKYKAESIGKSRVYTALSINNCKVKSLYINISKI